MIVENPRSNPHYLTKYFPLKPTVIDKNRTERGDYYEKPTQYWFVNCKPAYNLILETQKIVNKLTIDRPGEFELDVNRKVKRSMIHPQYARRFIREFILDGGWNGDDKDDQRAGGQYAEKPLEYEHENKLGM